MSETQDIYLENPPRQPKKDIADYLEGMGILVPRRFKTFEEALAAVRQGCKVIIRSEHPQDYAGVSDIMQSRTVDLSDLEKVLAIDPNQNQHSPDFYPVLSKGVKGELGERQFELELAKSNDYYIQIYSKLTGIESDEFYREVSFSYWERLDGYNRAIVADSSIQGRYHLFTDEPEGYFSNFSVIDKEKIVFSQGEELAEELRGQILEVIEFYERIRCSDGFDPNHCPLVEFQTVGNSNYFLQYHRTRDFSPSEWVLERDKEPDEKEVYFVRGATSPDGIILDTTFFYESEDEDEDHGNFLLMEREDASFDFHHNFIFADIMSRRRIANFDRYLNVSPSKRHSFKTKAFKAKTYVALGPCETFDSIANKIFEEALSASKPTHIKISIRLISDGRRAFVKMIAS